MSLTGHEGEFRQLFATESQARLQALTARAVEFASGDRGHDLLDEMFRNVHTLRGGAAIVGLELVAQIAQEFEALLADLRNGRCVSPPDAPAAGTAMRMAVDELQALIAASLGNGDDAIHGAAVRSAIAQIREPGEDPIAP